MNITWNGRFRGFLFLTAALTVAWMIVFPRSGAADEAELIAALRSPERTESADYARYAACLELTRMGTAQCVEALGTLLDDEKFCAPACTALIHLPDHAGMPVLRTLPERITAGLSERNQETIVTAIGQVGDPSAKEVLGKLNAKPGSALATAIERVMDRLDHGGDAPLKPLMSPVPDAATSDAAAEFADRPPSPEEISALLGADISDNAEARRRLEYLCTTWVAPEEIVAVLEKECRAATDTRRQMRLVELLAMPADANAAAALARLALTGPEPVTDTATRVLGEWTTVDAADALLQVARECESPKYRPRALRGYLRLVRQIGELTVDERETMLDAVRPLAVRPEEQELIGEIIEKVIEPARDRLRIFNGENFDGWEGDETIFRVEDGAIVGGSMERSLDRNEFMCTRQAYGDFVLNLECKVIGDGGNGGVQIRSVRVSGDREMSGYQADMTTDGTYYGCLYDESRRNRFLARPEDELQVQSVHPNDWNYYKIVCRGENIRLYLNGVLTVDYTEEDPTIPQRGIIGLQIHAGGPSQTFYRNITLESLD